MDGTSMSAQGASRAFEVVGIAGSLRGGSRNRALLRAAVQSGGTRTALPQKGPPSSITKAASSRHDAKIPLSARFTHVIVMHQLRWLASLAVRTDCKRPQTRLSRGLDQRMDRRDGARVLNSPPDDRTDSNRLDGRRIRGVPTDRVFPHRHAGACEPDNDFARIAAGQVG